MPVTHLYPWILQVSKERGQALAFASFCSNKETCTFPRPSWEFQAWKSSSPPKQRDTEVGISQLPRMTLPPVLLALNNMTGSFKESPEVSEQVRLKAAVENRKKSISQEDQPPVQEGRGAQCARAVLFAKHQKEAIESCKSAASSTSTDWLQS